MGQSITLNVLRGITLNVYRGEILAIVGHSGAGKSTLLHILGALDRPNCGEVFLENLNIFNMNNSKLAQFRNKQCGFIFQFHHLLPEFTALENVAMPGLIARNDSKQVFNNAEKLLKEVGLAERIKHKPSELSGGEQQRVAFARSLINDPILILADEPSGNLDFANSEALHKLMWQMVRKTNKTFVVVTHNRELAVQADRVVELYYGEIKSLTKGKH